MSTLPDGPRAGRSAAAAWNGLVAAAARRMQCTNNLKQLALALMNCESANAVFPAQPLVPMSVKSDPNSAVGWGPSWIVPILQYTEQTAAYNAYNFGDNPCVSSTYGWANSTVTSMKLSTLICPSDDQQGGAAAAGRHDGLVLRDNQLRRQLQRTAQQPPGAGRSPRATATTTARRAAGRSI